MNYILDNNGFILYCTPFTVSEKASSTAIGLGTGFHKPQFINNAWQEGITPQELEVLKAKKKQELNQLQFKELEQYDWYFTRLVRNETAVPQAILDTIKEIEIRYDALKLQL